MAGTGSATPFAALLRRLRQQAGLTQEELADRAGLTSHAVSSLERGVRTRPHPHTVRALSAALGADPSTRAELLQAVPRRGGPEPATTAAALPPAPVLPVPPTPLLGRQDDLDAVVRLLVTEGRPLVTLSGTGGVGKTRLAAAVAEAVAGAFPAGTTGVALAAVSDPDDVLPVIARAVGAPVFDGDVLGAVAAALHGRRRLLVLDNFEQLLPAAPQVAALVAACPTTAFLVTSRAPLRVRGEVEHSVEPLPVPAADDEHAVGESPAAALLLERARAAAPAFGTAPHEAAVVAALCRRLAGIPLALELAAARARVLDAEAMLARLDASACGVAARDLPPRQQTMRATLDWSADLLSPRERRLLRLLSVFAGGFDLSAVEAVAGEHVLPSLQSLVEHHLVVVRPGGRYDLLEPVAQYARSLLGGQEHEAARSAHARHFLRLAQQAHDGYAQEDHLDWLARAEQDEDNLLMTVEAALAAGDTRTAARACWDLQRFWWFRQRTARGAELCAAVLAAADPSGADMVVASLAAGCTALALDDVSAARAHWEAAYAGADRVDDIDVRAHAGAGLGLTALVEGDLALADARLVAAHQRASRSSRGCCQWLASMCLIWRGTVLTAAGHRSAAQASVERGLASAAQRGDRLAVHMALYNLAHQAATAGERDTARRHLVEGVQLAHRTGDLTTLAHVTQSLVVLEVAAGRPRDAAVLQGAADALLETAGTRGRSYQLLDRSALLDACRQARELLGDEAYEDAVDRGRRLPPDGLRDHVLRTAAPRLQVVEQPQANAAQHPRPVEERCPPAALAAPRGS